MILMPIYPSLSMKEIEIGIEMQASIGDVSFLTLFTICIVYIARSEILFYQ